MDLFVSFSGYKRSVFPCSSQELYGTIPSDGLCQYVNRVTLTSVRLHTATPRFPSLASLAWFQASGAVGFPLVLIFKQCHRDGRHSQVWRLSVILSSWCILGLRAPPKSQIHTHMSNATWPTSRTSSKLSWRGFHVFPRVLISVLLEVDDL